MKDLSMKKNRDGSFKVCRRITAKELKQLHALLMRGTFGAVLNGVAKCALSDSRSKFCRGR